MSSLHYHQDSHICWRFISNLFPVLIFSLFTLVSRWVCHGELSCRLFRGYVLLTHSFLFSFLQLVPYIYIKFMMLELSVLLCYLSCQACTDPETLKSCSDWLKGSVLGEQLLGLTEELCKVGSSSCDSISSTSGHSWMLISLVLSQHHNNGEHKIKHFYKKKILFCLLVLLKNHVFCLFYICRVSDRRGVHGENLGETPRHSV